MKVLPYTQLIQQAASDLHSCAESLRELVRLAREARNQEVKRGGQ